MPTVTVIVLSSADDFLFIHDRRTTKEKDQLCVMKAIIFLAQFFSLTKLQKKSAQVVFSRHITTMNRAILLIELLPTFLLSLQYDNLNHLYLDSACGFAKPKNLETWVRVDSKYSRQKLIALEEI